MTNTQEFVHTAQALVADGGGLEIRL